MTINTHDTHIDEKTEILYGVDNAINLLTSIVSSAKTILYACVDSSGPQGTKVVKKIFDKAPNIKILNGINCPFGIYIVDGQKFLKVEMRVAEAEIFSEAIGLAFYSNSIRSTESFKGVFELLWNERRLNEELHRAEKMQKEFINIAAHELRTPIQPIIGLSEVVLRNTKDMQQAKLLEVINRNAKRLHRLTEDILDVTKIESQSLNLKKEYFNLNDVITENQVWVAFIMTNCFQLTKET